MKMLRLRTTRLRIIDLIHVFIRGENGAVFFLRFNM